MKLSALSTIDAVAGFCKQVGFIFPSGEIYGGLAGFWDYGPAGVELKRNLMNSWWKTFVQSREDIVGIDGSIITHPKVWQASGHADSFTDPKVDCSKCKKSLRVDQLIEDALKIPVTGMSLEKMAKMLEDHKIRCPYCKGELAKPKVYNLMFRTNVGPIDAEENKAYLRPETAQLIFANFKNVVDSTSVRLPFGIAQIGKAFRNEIAPRDFVFRCREFEQMEIEYFVHPLQMHDCPYLTEEILKRKLNVLPVDAGKHKEMTVKQLLDDKIIKNPWLAYWLSEQYYWFINLGIKPENMRMREHEKAELAHYASACWDIEYNFPFGWKELQGMADRGQYDLSQHIKFSGLKLDYFDPISQKRVIPCVAAEPSQGVDRAFLAFLLDAYAVEKVGDAERRVMKLSPKLAPVKVAVFPLLKKDNLIKLARKVYEDLKESFLTKYEATGSIGKSYRRQDEIGTPFCLTIDFDSLKKKDVTVRERDSMKQKRVKIKELKSYLSEVLG